MSIEKLGDESTTQIEAHPFTIIMNSVINEIKDNDAFRVWAFSMSKPRNWKVMKEWTIKECGIGKRKGKQIWSYLQRCGLLMTFPVKDEQGKILRWDLRILSGSKFNPQEPFLKPTGAEKAPCEQKTTGAETAPVGLSVDKSPILNKNRTKNHRCKNPPCGETTRVVFAPLIKKEGKKERAFKINKEKSFCDQKAENQKRHSFADSMDAMASERRHIEQNEEFKRSPIPDYLRNIMGTLNEKIL